MRKRLMLALATATCLLANVAHSEDLNYSDANIWVGERGSIVNFRLAETSFPLVFSVSGTYINKDLNFSCRDTPFPMNGFYNSATKVMNFSVSWKNADADCKSVASWTGFFNSGTTVLITNWNLVGPDHTIMPGHDKFKPSRAK